MAKIGCELNSFELPAETAGQCFHQECLDQSRHADDQGMAPREKHCEQLFDDLVLPDDDPMSAPT